MTTTTFYKQSIFQSSIKNSVFLELPHTLSTLSSTRNHATACCGRSGSAPKGCWRGISPAALTALPGCGLRAKVLRIPRGKPGKKSHIWYFLICHKWYVISETPDKIIFCLRGWTHLQQEPLGCSPSWWGRRPVLWNALRPRNGSAAHRLPEHPPSSHRRRTGLPGCEFWMGVGGKIWFFDGKIRGYLEMRDVPLEELIHW